MAFSIYDSISASPVFSLFICLLRYIDYFIQTISFGYIPTIGGQLYDLVDKGLFKFILDKNINRKGESHDNFRLGPMSVTLIFDGQMAKNLLLNPDAKRGTMYDRLTIFFGKGIFTSNVHDRWKRQRTAILCLFNNRNLRQITPTLIESMFKELDRLIGQSENVDLVKVLSLMGLVGFCEAIFGVDITDISENLIEPLNNLLNYINGAVEPFLVKVDPAFRRFLTNKKIVHNWMRELINRARTSDRCLPIMKKYLDDHNNIDDDTELVEFILSVVLGGHETTARLMLGIIYSLIKDKSIIQRLNTETQNYPDYQFEIMKRSYLGKIVKEGTRLFPPVWLLSREVKQDLILDSHKFNKNNQFLISPLIFLRDHKVWGQDSESFNPDRFDNLNRQALDLFIPFVVGGENCPAKIFAELETALVVSKLFSEYKIELLTDKINPMSAGTFRLTDNLPVIIKKL